MVAPSYQNCLILSAKPFLKNNKLYVTVLNQKTNSKKDARWYNETEYAKAYGNKVINTNLPINNMKEEIGFSNGPILVIRNNEPRDQQFLHRSKAKYIVGVGWYFRSDATLPKDAPPHFKYLLLGWNEFKQDNTHMRKPAEIAAILDKKAKDGKWINFDN